MPVSNGQIKARQKTTYKVSNLELFGQMQDAGTVPEGIDAPKTKLNLELQGIFISEDERRSTAIVAEKGKTGELFEIGDRLPGNATLAAVHEDHVLLRRGSKMEKLLFSDTKFQLVSTNRQGTSAKEPTNTRNSKRKNLEQIRDRIRNKATKTEPQKDKSNSRQDLSAYRDRLKSDPIGALGELGVSPVSDGEPKGYKVGAEAEGAIRQAGLQPGDVVLSVNGKPIGVASNDSALMEQVMASSRVRVEVQRGSRRFFLTVPVPK